MGCSAHQSSPWWWSLSSGLWSSSSLLQDYFYQTTWCYNSEVSHLKTYLVHENWSKNIQNFIQSKVITLVELKNSDFSTGKEASLLVCHNFTGIKQNLNLQKNDFKSPLFIYICTCIQTRWFRRSLDMKGILCLKKIMTIIMKETIKNMW